MSAKPPRTFHPKPSFRLGQATIPRFSGGWMPQFGHIYALQREMSKSTNSWFRAAELWHVARSEGVPYASHNYAHILQMCNRDKQWLQAMKIVTQMRKDAITVETDCAQHILAACMRCGAWETTLRFFGELQRTGTKLNELCLVSVFMAVRAFNASNPNAHEISTGEAVRAFSESQIENPSSLLQNEIVGLLEELPEVCAYKEELMALVAIQSPIEAPMQSFALPPGAEE